MSELVGCTELQALSDRGALGDGRAAHLVGCGSAMSKTSSTACRPQLGSRAVAVGCTGLQGRACW